VGLIGLYSGLAQGRIGIVAPLTAVLAATLPILFSLLTEGFPPILNVAGFGLALVAVWFLTGVGRSTAVSRTELGYALLAGTGFALFFIFIDQATDELVFWPLVAARIASVVCLGLLVLVRRSWQRPPRNQLPIIFLTGIFDALGNAFFAAAARVGRLDIAAVLASLYPVTTVLLAQLVLHERLNRSQWVGVGLALLALVLITV
jgi:drug/metabolite transporter (DMT)-like permease